MDRKECYRLTHPLSKISGYAAAGSVKLWPDRGGQTCQSGRTGLKLASARVIVSESSSQWVISQWVTSGTGGCGGGGGSDAGRAVDVRRPSSSLDQTPPTAGSVDRPAAVSRRHRLAVKNYPPTRTRLPSGLSPVRRRRLPRSNPSTSWTYLPIRQQVTLLFR